MRFTWKEQRIFYDMTGAVLGHTMYECKGVLFQDKIGAFKAFKLSTKVVL